MTNAVQIQQQSNVIESVVVEGDLSRLSPQQRVEYYRQVCESVGLNPFTKPFDYIKLNGKLTLYAKKDATDQLRSLRGVSIGKPDIEYLDDLVVVTVTASDATGRTDSDLGAVTIGNLKGDARANAMMKAITKAKRRVTLSICGLGWLDETELDTIPSAEPVVVDADSGEIVESAPVQVTAPEPPRPASTGNGKISDKTRRQLHALGTKVYGDAWDDKRAEFNKHYGTASSNDWSEEQAAKIISGMNKLNTEQSTALRANDQPQRDLSQQELFADEDVNEVLGLGQ